jgi:hypothetical protein
MSSKGASGSTKSSSSSGTIHYRCAGCGKEYCDNSGPNRCIGQPKIPNQPVTNGVCAGCGRGNCANLAAYGVDCLGHQGGYPKDQLAARKKKYGGYFYEEDYYLISSRQ